jgi:hypothetical protein
MGYFLKLSSGRTSQNSVRAKFAESPYWHLGK